MGTNNKITGFEKREHIAIITIPGFTTDDIGTDVFSYELSGLCADIEMDEEVRVVIIASPEEKTPHKGETTEKSLFTSPQGETSALLPHLSESIAGLDRPTIAAIHGDAFGQGLELAMACDMRIASKSSRFGMPHIHEGLAPQNGGTQRLPRLVGKGKALEMILTGKSIDAGEALRIGLVNMVQSSGDVTWKGAGSGPGHGVESSHFAAVCQRSNLQRDGFDPRSGTPDGRRSLSPALRHPGPRARHRIISKETKTFLSGKITGQ